jgi:hypothetical protein
MIPSQTTTYRLSKNVAVITLLLLAGAGLSTAKSSTSSGAHVTSTVYDTDLNLNALLLQGDDVNAAGLSTYTTSSTSGVISQIDGYGQDEWDLWLQNSSRGFQLTLTTKSGSSVNGFPTGPYLYSGRLVSRCFDPTGATTNPYAWVAITSADPNCAMRVNFTYGGTQYTLVMGPTYSGTGRAEVYCNVLSGTGCIDWTIVPNLNAANVANLYAISKSGKETFVATCKLTYRVHVTYP